MMKYISFWLSIYSVILSTATFIIFAINSIISNRRDKAKQTMLFISKFSKTVIPTVELAGNSKTLADKITYSYKTMKMIIKLYLRVDSRLVNEALIAKYILHDLLLINKALLPVVKYMTAQHDYQNCGLQLKDIL